ncbi:ATP-binding protein [Paractinoplanes brasiliensis]|nr:ATP-binding protein [Actinoplanes brasiliensis]GID33237.1 hypothetical protein Abr02nite_82200 [Actinoplanes brasiliensis]
MPEPHRTPTTGHSHRPAGLLARDFTIENIVELRHAVTRLAEDNGLADVALYRFVIAVHEIAVNAIRHGGGQGRLEMWRADAHLHCRISDHGPGMPTAPGRPVPAITATTGRGLWLARRSCQMTTRVDDAGTTITLTCPIRPPQA